jgi:hypothetical protein
MMNIVVDKSTKCRGSVHRNRKKYWKEIGIKYEIKTETESLMKIGRKKKKYAWQ